MRSLYGSVLLGSVALIGCGTSIDLEPVVAGRDAKVAPALALASVHDARQDEAIGYGQHEWLRVGYEVDTDADVAAWLGSYLRASLEAHAHGAAPAPGVLDVTLHRFVIQEATWARGVADLEVRVRWSDGGVSSRRLRVITTELMGDDDAGAWAVAADHLASWASEEVARWSRAEAQARRPPEL
ncbi:MAG: hypothetical protein WKG00_26905 [Polyangiaceae bacterium]